jgi:ribosomal protein S18 acetylase RimI-like enzyme
MLSSAGVTDSSSDVSAIERAAFAAWPAEQVVGIGGWRIRFTGGVTRRANSVWTFEERGGALSRGELGERIARAESFYRGQGVRPMFQVPTTAGELDAELADCGYVVEAPVAVMTRTSSELLVGEPSFAVTVESIASEDWFELSGRKGRFASVQPIYRALLDRMGNRACFALARDSSTGEAISVGLGVVDGRLCGISSMMTLPAHRGRGAAGAVLAALAAAAEGRDVRTLYLQVERSNPAAMSLYARLGFVERYGYHYRIAAL